MRASEEWTKDVLESVRVMLPVLPARFASVLFSRVRAALKSSFWRLRSFDATSFDSKLIL